MMKYLIAIALLLSSIAVQAATLYVAWTDPTPTSPAYAPKYTLEYRVNGGTATTITGLIAPSTTQTITAVSGNTVEVRYRAENTIVPAYPVVGPWTAWLPVTGAVQPVIQPVPSATIFIY